MLYGQQQGSIPVFASAKQIGVNFILKDQVGGQEDYTCEVSVLVDPQY